jgi:hypothetical protein
MGDLSISGSENVEDQTARLRHFDEEAYDTALDIASRCCQIPSISCIFSPELIFSFRNDRLEGYQVSEQERFEIAFIIGQKIDELIRQRQVLSIDLSRCT